MPMLMQVEYPESFPDVLSESRQEFEFEAKMAMAAKMFELKRLSSGQAAQMLGMGRVEFLLSLHKMGTPAINLTADDLLSDLKKCKGVQQWLSSSIKLPPLQEATAQPACIFLAVRSKTLMKPEI